MSRPFLAILDGVRPRDAIDLMVWPCFALAKRPHHAALFYENKRDFMRVTSVPDGPGIATIWDAEILTWAVSQLAEAQDQRLYVSPVLSSSAFQLLRFRGRGTNDEDYRQLGSALGRLAGTQIETSVGATAGAPARFRWIETWERSPGKLDVTISDWLFHAVIERRRILRIDPSYRRLTGGIERWLWRLLRRYVQKNSTAWEVSFAALYARSGSRARATDFSCDLRRIAQTDALPGYALSIVKQESKEWLRCAPSPDRIHRGPSQAVDNRGISSTNPGSLL